MKILHTSDWHVGKVLKGRSRAEEHKQVLAQVIEIASIETREQGHGENLHVVLRCGSGFHDRLVAVHGRK